MFVFRNKITSKQVKRGLGITLMISGLLLLFVSPVEARISQLKDFQTYLSSIQSQTLDPIQIDNSLINENYSEKNFPKRILIPKNEIDLEISPAKVIHGKWEVFNDKAGFGLGSALPSEDGNTVVFAHAKEGQFLNLRDIKPDQEILIFTDNSWYSYKVSEVKEVRPTDISVIAQTDESLLTLFTCSGFADSKRLIVVAKKVR